MSAPNLAPRNEENEGNEDFEGRCKSLIMKQLVLFQGVTENAGSTFAT